jgi:DNA (cytosine-5)-methyltransferase 1
MELFENHGIDSRYTGPHEVAPTMSARYGTGGNNLPLVAQEDDTFCISGNAIDREPENGGNGLGCQSGISYTVTTTDRHAVYERQNLIRRLTPLECERLQGFPDGWTDVGGSDSARYKALGNSVAIPCVEFVMRGIAHFFEGRRDVIEGSKLGHGD